MTKRTNRHDFTDREILYIIRTPLPDFLVANRFDTTPDVIRDIRKHH